MQKGRSVKTMLDNTERVCTQIRFEHFNVTLNANVSNIAHMQSLIRILIQILIQILTR